jgi:hypothetical protein
VETYSSHKASISKTNTESLLGFFVLYPAKAGSTPLEVFMISINGILSSGGEEFSALIAAVLEEVLGIKFIRVQHGSLVQWKVVGEIQVGLNLIAFVGELSDRSATEPSHLSICLPTPIGARSAAESAARVIREAGYKANELPGPPPAEGWMYVVEIVGSSVRLAFHPDPEKYPPTTQ